MTDSADERTKVDRTKDPEDPAKDVREEYTGYRDGEPDRTGSEEEKAEEETGKERGKEAGTEPEKETEKEARREAELQPGSPEPEKDDRDDNGER